MHAAKNPRGFTLIELLVVVSIITALIAILLPSLGKARERARIVQCVANFRSLGQAEFVYAGQYGGRGTAQCPDTGTGYSWNFWENTLLNTKSISSYKMFCCPQVIINGTVDYTAAGNSFSYWRSTTINQYIAGKRPAASMLFSSINAASSVAYIGEEGYGYAFITTAGAQTNVNRGENSFTDGSTFGANHNISFPGGTYRGYLNNSYPVENGAVTIVFADGHAESIHMIFSTAVTSGGQDVRYDPRY